MNERNGIVILFIIVVGMIFLNPNKASLNRQENNESEKANAYFEKIFQERLDRSPEFKMWLGINVNDSMSGFFALRKDLIKNLSFEAIGYKILLEILVKTKGAKVKEVPFVCINRQEGSTKFSFSIINDYFKLLRILRKNVSYNAKNRV
jgi:hypothetical protein